MERRAHPRRVRRVGRRPGRDPCPRPPRLCGTAGRQHEKLGQKITHQKASGQAGGLFYSPRRRGRGRSAPKALYSCSQRLELWSQRNRAGSAGPAVRSSILKPRKSPARFSNFPEFTKQSSSSFSFSSQLHKSKNHAPQPPHGERLAVIASPLPRSSRKERQLPLRWKEGPWNLCRKFLASFPISRNHAFFPANMIATARGKTPEPHHSASKPRIPRLSTAADMTNRFESVPSHFLIFWNRLSRPARLSPFPLDPTR